MCSRHYSKCQISLPRLRRRGFNHRWRSTGSLHSCWIIIRIITINQPVLVMILMWAFEDFCQCHQNRNTDRLIVCQQRSCIVLFLSVERLPECTRTLTIFCFCFDIDVVALYVCFMNNFLTGSVHSCSWDRYLLVISFLWVQFSVVESQIWASADRTRVLNYIRTGGYTVCEVVLKHGFIDDEVWQMTRLIVRNIDSLFHVRKKR